MSRMLAGQLALAAAVVMLSGCPGGGSEQQPGPGSLDVDLNACVAKMNACTGEQFLSLTYALLLEARAMVPELFEEQYGEVLGCVDSAGTCDAVLECLGADLDSSCEKEEFEERCAGGKAVRCASIPDGKSLVVHADCAVEGRDFSCFIDALGRAECGTGTCSTEGERCDGTVAVDCEDGVEERFDCASEGLVCKAADDEAVCSTGEACTVDSCNGPVITGCEEGWATLSFDCSLLSPEITCVVDPDDPDDVDCAVPPGKDRKSVV